MILSSRFAFAAALAAVLAFSGGCTDSATPVADPSAPPADTGHDDHDHAADGPHGGTIVELGTETYHAELIHDDAAGTVTVYVLDSSASAVIPIQATEILINLAHEGEAEQFALAASPDADDPEGFSSRFVSSEAELAEELDHGHEAELVMTVDGKQYRGSLAHDHDHEGHSH